jgi:transglutaminase-like putative cysteine protease
MSPAIAGEEDAAELFTRFAHYHVSYVINEDGSFVESQDWGKTILKERALEYSKRASVTYSTSIDKAEIVEAYTRKADGRRIDVPKSNYQLEVNSGKDAGSPVYSDQTTLSVVFPDVAVGDTVVFSYKVMHKEPIFPQHFSVIGVYSRQTAFDDVRISIDWPSSLWTQYEARELTETKKAEKDGRKSVEWTFQNKRPMRSKRRDYSVYDVEKEPGFSFSTFKTHAESTEAYGARARPKAAVTERIRKLADEIAKDKKSQRDQARSLYDWVATNINYAGNCIGIGAVVPRDMDFVLDNRIGDCKDHATLLEALLAAKGIESKQALVNAGSSYRLHKIPVVSMVNHVINYIPAFDLYVDSTSETTPFGMLPFSSADKPVLMVDSSRAGARTPALPPGSNRQHMKTMVKVGNDGSMQGEVEISLKGVFAVEARDQMRDLPKVQEEDLVKNVFESMGHIGSGKFYKDDPKELLDTYQYKAKFSVEDFLQLPGAGAFGVQPVFFSQAPVERFLGAAIEPIESVDVSCANGESTEEYVYHLPKGMKILAVPKDMSVKNDFLSYRATYRLQGNVLTVKRTLEDKTVGNVCSPAVFKAYKKFAIQVQQNVKSQVVYK